VNISIDRIFADLNVQIAPLWCPVQTSKMSVPTYWTERYHGREDRSSVVLVSCLEIAKF